MEKKRNQTFQFLKALAILMVIDDHMSTRIGFLSSLFPYNSFYMPMFVFISGYFFKPQGIGVNVKHKIRRLLVPYLVWAMVGEGISYLLQVLGIVHWYVSPFSLRRVVRLLLIDSLSTITGASWFVIMLFWVSIIYNILYRGCKLGKRSNAYIFLCLSVVIGIIDLRLCRAEYVSESAYLFLLRTAWYLQFYHMGKMFREYWETAVQQWRLLYVCVACVAINVLLTCIYHDRLNFYSTSRMASFHSCWLPLITSVTGTLFWYKIMSFVAAKIGRIGAVDYLAEHTFTIMESHLFFINLPNFYAYYQYLRSNPNFADFPIHEFASSAWVRYSPNTRLIGFFLGLLGSLAVAWLIERCKATYTLRRLS